MNIINSICVNAVSSSDVSVATNNISESVVIHFFIGCGVVVGGMFLIMGIVFLLMTIKRLKNPGLDDEIYVEYLKKGYTLRFCYGCSVVADTFCAVVEIAATGISVFIVLIPDTESSLIVIMLIISFVSSAISFVLNLTNCRKAYARAFRILEFATDKYKTSEHKERDKRALREANIRAQKIIEDFLE